jgi:hypothetical protein
MSEETSEDKQKGELALKIMKHEEKIGNCLYFLLVVVLIILGIYFYNFHEGVPEQGAFAQFGDFIGGLLNPILSFAALLALLWTIRLQTEELGYTKIEIAKSSNALIAQEEQMRKQTNRLADQSIENLFVHTLKMHLEAIDNEVFGDAKGRASFNIKAEARISSIEQRGHRLKPVSGKEPLDNNFLFKEFFSYVTKVMTLINLAFEHQKNNKESSLLKILISNVTIDEMKVLEHIEIENGLSNGALFLDDSANLSRFTKAYCKTMGII